MKYALSIDWLQFWCKAETPFREIVNRHDTGTGLFASLPYTYEKAAYGTRQFRELWKVNLAGEELAEVQSSPCSSIFDADIVCIKFANRVLYMPNVWTIIEDTLRDLHFVVQNITRCDLCADFVRFHNNYEPILFITDFLAGKNRRVGRGDGGAYFRHGSFMKDGISRSFTNYNGLSFGSHTSHARVYLYNKSHELRCVKDKPYIRDMWKKAGILEAVTDPLTGRAKETDVWRLEVSIKSEGMRFKDAITGKRLQIDKRCLSRTEPILTEDGIVREPSLDTIFFTFIDKLFCFIPNRPGITNVTREKERNKIILFDDAPCMERAIIREKSCSNRAEKILLHALWVTADKYRGLEMADHNYTRQLAYDIAQSTDLLSWLDSNKTGWKCLTKK